jgi:large subunit ribosomal protein L13
MKSEKKWYLIDAKGQVLGRLATRIAGLLSGKGNPAYVPYLDSGDYVVVINAEKIILTGKKREQKLYHHHSGYPGGLKSVKCSTLLEKNPSKVIELAVKGMLPRGKLGRAMFKKLKVYRGSRHPHQSQALLELLK